MAKFGLKRPEVTSKKTVFSQRLDDLSAPLGIKSLPSRCDLPNDISLMQSFCMLTFQRRNRAYE